jgi:hypothetical protein
VTKEKEDIFKLIKEHMDEYPFTTPHMIEEDTGISRLEVKRLIETGRLVIPTQKAIFYSLTPQNLVEGGDQMCRS